MRAITFIHLTPTAVDAQLTRKLKATEGAVGEEREAADGGLAKAESTIADLTKRVNDVKRVSGDVQQRT